MFHASAIAPPEIAASAALPDEDAFLLEEPDRTNAGSSNPASGPGTPGRANVTDVSKKVDVSWLRKTEYLSSEAGSRQALQALNGSVASHFDCEPPAYVLPPWTRAAAETSRRKRRNSIHSTATVAPPPSPPRSTRLTSRSRSFGIRPSEASRLSSRSTCCRTMTSGRSSTTSCASARTRPISRR